MTAPRHELKLLADGTVACLRCRRIMDLQQFVESNVCVRQGEWLATAMLYLEEKGL